ncbi:CRISPR associated protein Cas6 [Caldanaerobius fijiensis DSM 17918]|uniref:CRISPR associated protein Cas6 n=1 Tax=Caldanaerobius fijiensis DSM 17918 TaxID=1121256 RepID=A0A1M4SLJ8_9THEO|nr:CRISPR-associated endoribonuclease Cas6 [Caldanaerobius fijiensis]SHE33065.1 CRISPR associated protein Cas6 [Caldanaerobius fijiensis DSM 17918]
MSVVKLRLEFDLNDNFFFDKEYKQVLSEYYYNIIGNGFFVFSDIIPKKKKNSNDGFWAIEKAAFDFSTVSTEKLLNVAMNAMKTPIQFKYGSLKIKKVRFLKVKLENKAYTLSPIIVFKNGNPLLYEESPEYFSEVLREILIFKYKDLFGGYPHDDRFVFYFKSKPLKEEINGFPVYKGCFEMIGSEDLIGLSYNTGLGSFNELGFGMISSDLYFWKKSTDIELRNNNGNSS